MSSEESQPTEATLLMTQAANGDRAAADRLLPLVYEQLRKGAQRQMAGERMNHTLSATALVHEAYLKLNGPRESPREGQGHFYAAAAEATPQVLLQRGGDSRSAAWFKPCAARGSNEAEIGTAAQALRPIDVHSTGGLYPPRRRLSVAVVRVSLFALSGSTPR